MSSGRRDIMPMQLYEQSALLLNGQRCVQSSGGSGLVVCGSWKKAGLCGAESRLGPV